MTDVIAHRGPDGEGHWIEGPMGLGHRRLAIIDPSPAGHQPMLSPSGRYALVYNGEIYNFRELRTELERQGCVFHSKTDSEVVLLSLEVWGISAIERFNGMFAFALWDRQRMQLTLARDRYGIKPLYYAHQRGWFVFGSEQKAILAWPKFNRSLDPETLYEYLTFQNIFTDRTLLEDIRLLPAGHYGTISLSGAENNSLSLNQYWDYNFVEPEVKLDYRAYLEELERLFVQAVNRQMVSDVEVGSYLSGGMDSGSITAVASKSYPNLKTFTCGFDLSSASGLELSFDERAKAEAMSADFKTEHYEMVLKAGDMERCLPKLAFHLEEPRVGQSYPNYYAAQLASKFVKVVMSGAGGDELFGGYPWRYYRAVKNDSLDDYIEKYYAFWQRLTTDQERKKLFSNLFSANSPDIDSRDVFRSVFPKDHPNQCTPEDYINLSLHFEAKTFLQGLFIVEDKLSMAHGLEARVPFMDNDLVDFAMKCPVSLKISNLAEVVKMDENQPGNKPSQYFKKTADGKKILRQMMRSYVKPEITENKKQGFSSPDSSWFRGESIEFVKKIISDPHQPLFKYLDKEAVTEMVSQHLSGAKNRRLLVWSVLNLNQYFKEVGL